MKKRVYTIGRGKGNDIVISKVSVSRRHAELTIEEGCMTLKDCGSKNGTYILDNNAKIPIKTSVVAPDDKVAFGDVVFTVGELLSKVSVRNGKVQDKGHVITPPSLAKKRRCRCGAIRVVGYPCEICGERS